MAQDDLTAEERAAILADPGFGNFFTDHTAIVDFRTDGSGAGGWHDARLEPYGPIALDPAAAVLLKKRQLQLRDRLSQLEDE